MKLSEDCGCRNPRFVFGNSFLAACKTIIKNSGVNKAATMSPYEKLDRVVLYALQVPLGGQKAVRPAE